jgi:hypothetical protein
MLVVSAVSVVGSMISTDVELFGTQYIFPLGARQAPAHLASPVKPVMLVVSAVSVAGSMISTDVE